MSAEVLRDNRQVCRRSLALCRGRFQTDFTRKGQQILLNESLLLISVSRSTRLMCVDYIPVGESCNKSPDITRENGT